MGVTIDLPPDIERELKDRAAKDGQALEDYVRTLLVRKANGTTEGPVSSGHPISSEEFERLLDELSEPGSLPELPADFSRADIYVDHD